MTAEKRDARLAQLVEAAGKDFLEDGAVGVFRKRRDRQRGQRPSPHRIHIAERIGSRDLPVHKRLVHDWREEIHGLHERARAIQPVHTGIIRSPIIDEDPVVVVHGQITQHLGKLACGEFARSTGAGGVVS